MSNTPLKILADGTEVPATDPRTDHVAVRFPETGTIIAVTPLATADGESLPSQQAVIDAAKALRLLDRDDWELASSTDYMRHVIDHSHYGPAVDTNLFPSIDTRDWYWTSTAVPGFPSLAFCVGLYFGDVSNGDRYNGGFGLPCCRAREFQGAGDVQLRDLDQAYQQAHRGKQPSHGMARFDADFIRELRQLQAELNAGTWEPGPTTCFVATRPKAREIHAPPFRDRVVHHAAVPAVEAVYERRFHHHSYANRAGKGTHAAVQYAQACVRQVHSGQGGGFYLQLDIANCFVSIRRDLLWAMLKPVLVKADLPLWLQRVMHALLRGDPLRAGVIERATPQQFALVPPHKRLCNARPRCGLPVGNLPSQFLVNVYLDPLDQFVKHALKCRRYLRYVDDFVLFHHDRHQLEIWLAQIESFLADKLDLRLKADVKLRPLTDGLDFLGYVIFPTHTLARRRVVSHLRQALAEWEAAHVRGDALRGTPADFDHIRTVLASYAGHLQHADSHRLWRSLHRRHPWISAAAAPRRFSHRLQGRHLTIRINAR